MYVLFLTPLLLHSLCCPLGTFVFLWALYNRSCPHRAFFSPLPLVIVVLPRFPPLFSSYKLPFIFWYMRTNYPGSHSFMPPLPPYIIYCENLFLPPRVLSESHVKLFLRHLIGGVRTTIYGYLPLFPWKRSPLLFYYRALPLWEASILLNWLFTRAVALRE